MKSRGEALAEENIEVISDLWEEYSPGTQLNPLYHTGGCSLTIKGGRGQTHVVQIAADATL